MIDTAGQMLLADVDAAATGLVEVRVPVGEIVDGLTTRATACAWSGAGQWTAWSLSALAIDGPNELRIHDEATDSSWVLAEAFTAFYLAPSPCGRYLSHLSPGPLGLELAVSDVRSGELRVIERGQPLFWAWSDDSTRLAVHVGNRLVIAPLDGSGNEVITEEAGSFVAPQWLPGESVAFVGRDPVRGFPAVLVHGPDGSQRPLVALGDNSVGGGRFVLDPDGRRIALIDDAGHLVIHDLLSDERTTASTANTVAFFWSPAGDRLAALTIVSPTEVAWSIFDGTRSRLLEPFRPGGRWFSSVLPFFEQYSRSHSVWSSDGSALVAIAASGGDGAPTTTDAVVQRLDEHGSTQRVERIELAWWAPG